MVLSVHLYKFWLLGLSHCFIALMACLAIPYNHKAEGNFRGYALLSHGSIHSDSRCLPCQEKINLQSAWKVYSSASLSVQLESFFSSCFNDISNAAVYVWSYLAQIQEGRFIPFYFQQSSICFKAVSLSFLRCLVTLLVLLVVSTIDFFYLF